MKKLTLHREQLQELNGVDLGTIQGGMDWMFIRPTGPGDTLRTACTLRETCDRLRCNPS